MAVNNSVEQTGAPAPDPVAGVPDYHAAAVHAQSQIHTFLVAAGLSDEVADDVVGSMLSDRAEVRRAMQSRGPDRSSRDELALARNSA
ncbi:hypothetical protein ACFYZ5_40060 [Streptomyces chartreusis]|uniref:hypothetical protein n=1 Tax=Streptomyces chartreusis TaxID=1969 RepID=UPI0036BDFFA9